jgi:hypothetical protein
MRQEGCGAILGTGSPGPLSANAAAVAALGRMPPAQPQPGGI